jgi:hypothetical protein
MFIADATPLCLARHLPLKGGDQPDQNAHDTGASSFRFLYPSAGVKREWRRFGISISPLEGEMSGRTEGGTTAKFKAFGRHP